MHNAFQAYIISVYWPFLCSHFPLFSIHSISFLQYQSRFLRNDITLHKLKMYIQVSEDFILGYIPLPPLLLPLPMILLLLPHLLPPFLTPVN